MLKQTESFMHKNLISGPYTDSDYCPLARQITKAHETDEARHFTTSLEIGLSLFSQASVEARRLVQSTMSMFTTSFIAERFAPDPRTTQLYARARVALREALGTPEFDGTGKTVEELETFWQRAAIRIPERNEYESSLRWLAGEVRRLIERADLRIPPSTAFDRVQELASS